MDREERPTGAQEKEQKPIYRRALAFLRALVSDWRPLGTDWQPTRTQRLWIVRIAVVLGILVASGYPLGITLWDWLKLLIIPAVIAAGGVWFNQQQRERELKSANRRAQDDALQAYLGAMSELMLNYNLRTPQSNEHTHVMEASSPSNQAAEQPDEPVKQSKDDVATVARARTLAVLPMLDEDSKASVLLFLHESDLIATDERDILDLHGANLRHAKLSGANLCNANLSGAYLSYADLSGAYLSGANLRGTYLLLANLEDADLIAPPAYIEGMYNQIRSAKLKGSWYAFDPKTTAELKDAYPMKGADLSLAVLDYANLERARLNSISLQHARLSHANLQYTNLEGADLQGADFSDADLSHARLDNADLRSANLSNARGATNEELAEQAQSLKGATMPNGQKYEDWLKDRGEEESRDTS